MSASQRLSLPFLTPGQAQKEMVHNESLQLLDSVVAAAVDALPGATPPQSPAAGSCYLVAAGATGAWEGRDHHLAAYTAGGWRFVAPVEGLSALIKPTGMTATYHAGAWQIGELRAASLMIGGQQVVGSQLQAIPNPSGGGTVDAEARSAISAMLDAMRQHGLIAN